MSKRNISAIVLLIFIWSIYFICVKLSVNLLSSHFVGVYVRLFTLIALTIYMGIKRNFHLLIKTKRVMHLLILIGVFGFGLDITAFIGMKMTTVSNASLLLKLDVLFANLITVLIYRQKLTFINWFSTIITLIGVMIVLKVDILHFRFTGIGDLLLILSSLIVTVNAFLIKSLQNHKSGEIQSEVIAYYNNFVTLILFTIVLVGSGQYTDVVKIIDQPSVLFPLTVAGFGQTSIYIVYYYLLKRMPIWTVKLFLLLIPVLSTIFGYFILNEAIEVSQIIGMILVICGAWLTLIEQYKKSHLKHDGISL